MSRPRAEVPDQEWVDPVKKLERSLGEKLTPAMVKALRWFADHGPVHLFDAQAPSKITRKKLEAAGLVVRCGVQRDAGSPFGFTRYDLSAPARRAIAHGVSEDK